MTGQRGGRLPADTATLLHLGSEPAHVIVGLFAVTNIAFAIIYADAVTFPAVSMIALVLVLGAAVMLMVPGPDPYPLARTWIVIAVVGVSTALVTWNLPDTGEFGRATWHQSANAWLLFFLALRRRTGLAWVGFALMAALTAAWGVTSGRGALSTLMMLNTHAGTLVVATLLGAGLRRASRDIDAFSARADEAAQAQAEAQARREIRRRRVAEVVQTAGAPLRRIAQGAPFTEAERVDFQAAEADLRDSVRARGLTTPAVVTSAAAARRRGVQVVLLDDRGEPVADGLAMQRLSDAVAKVLDDATGGVVTVRLLPPGRETLLTIVAQQGDDATRITLGADGGRVD